MFDDDMQRLIEAADLQPLLDDVLLVHVADPSAYAAAHLPGALLVAPADLVGGVKPATGRLPDDGRLTALFSALGYRPEQRVVAYDDEGGGWAGRFLWTLDVIGHDDWAYLNGGVHAWHAARLPLETGAGRTATATPVELQIHTGPIAEAEDLLARLGESDLVIWDVRSREEFDGTRQAALRSGHVPGAQHLDWMELKNPQDHMRLVEDLGGLLARHGITPDKDVITHCQTHHRSGLSYLVARALGFPRIRAYHGSWSEWGNREDTPIETSMPSSQRT